MNWWQATRRTRHSINFPKYCSQFWLIRPLVLLSLTRLADLFSTPLQNEFLAPDLIATRPPEKRRQLGFYLPDKTSRCLRDQLPWHLCVRGQTVHEMTLFVRRQGVSDGIWVKVTCTPLGNELGEIGGACGLLLADTTEQVQVEQQIESLCDNLEQQFSLLGSAQYELKLLTDKLAKNRMVDRHTDSSVAGGSCRASFCSGNRGASF